MDADVVLLPGDLAERNLRNRTAVVFDVLRATTSIAAALCAGASEIRVFGSLEDARSARAGFNGRAILAGEFRCLKAEGFDLGNSPGEFTTDRCSGATIFLATTNGTRALVKSRPAERLFAAALVNASTTAAKLASLDRDVTLVCSGTDGEIAPEDIIGAGAVLAKLMEGRPSVDFVSDRAQAALYAYEKAEATGFVESLRQTRGGRNIIAASLDADIDFAARLDAYPVVAECEVQNLIIRTASQVDSGI
jgi:2-phosphosulfolactate phosphatase